MPTRVTPSAAHRTPKTPLGLSRLLQARMAHRRAVRGELELQRALTGRFGNGVRAEVLAAQYRSATPNRTAA